MVLAPVDLAAEMPVAGVLPFDDAPDAGAVFSLDCAALSDAGATLASSKAGGVAWPDAGATWPNAGGAWPDAGAAFSERVLGGE